MVKVKVRLKAPWDIEVAEAIASELKYRVEKLPPYIQAKTKIRYWFWSTRVTVIYKGRELPHELLDTLRSYRAYL